MYKDFPNELSAVLEEISKERNIKLEKNNHFEAVNRELSWFTNNSCNRLDFTLKESNIVTTYYLDSFLSSFPKFSIWCYNNIPNFHPKIKVSYCKLDDFSLQSDLDNFKKSVNSLIDKINQGDLNTKLQ